MVAAVWVAVLGTQFRNRTLRRMRWSRIDCRTQKVRVG
jgi:hypothetical protein